MAIGVFLIGIIVLIIAIWLIIDLKRMRHKLFAIFLVILILFLYFSITYTLKNKNVDLTTLPGIIEAGKIYFSWLGSIFNNAITITTHVIKMDWGIKNATSGS